MTISLVRHPTDDDWMLVKQSTLVTVGLKSMRPPDEE